MHHKIVLLGALVSFLLLVACGREKVSLPDTVDFNFHIRPILSDRCFACHGPDDNTREADLALHTEEGAYAILDEQADHRVIKPGNPNASELYQRIVSDDPDIMMPPPASNLTLSTHEKALIERWIAQGAAWEDHWSFVPPQPVKPPSSGRWGHNPIDAFIHQSMRAQGLKPNAAETPTKLLRRAALDLTGLPPDEKLQSLMDDEQGGYEAVIDHLLDRPAYGERMASIWLDLARYADSHGYQDDRPRTMWPWRNWVIEAFNKNMPYDQFVTWQLAGDLLPDSLYEQRLATGFNRNHAITQEGGVVEEEYLTEYAVDRVDAFSTGFLGLTVQCARCHDHKYDPISQKEFYQLFAFFNNIKNERGRINYYDKSPAPSMREENPDLEASIAETIAAIHDLEKEQADLQRTPESSFDVWAQQPVNVQLPQPLVHFTLDEREGWQFRNALDESHTGKVNVNLPPRIPRPDKVDGRFGSALRFNGENFLTVGDVADFEWYDPFTLSAWIRPAHGQKMEGGILARRNGELLRNGYDLFIRPDRKIGIRLVNSLNDNHLEVVSKTPVPVAWTHVAATSNGSGTAAGLKLYIDGKPERLLVIRDSLNREPIACGNDLLVGNWNHRARILNKKLAGFAGGAVDEIKIFDRALSTLQVQMLAEHSVRAPQEYAIEHYALNFSERHKEIDRELAVLRRKEFSVPHIMVMEERDTVAPTHVLMRGSYDAPGELVNRGTPTEVLPFGAEFRSDRLGLAQWLFDEENPLTARVMVNRLWQLCFGQGLVATPEDFGSQGKLPSHPALLDWLAVQFRDSGWDVKSILKLMMTSATYRQSSAVDAKSATIDKENRWLSRAPYRPLTAEMTRDQALALSGALNRAIGGKWVKPYQPPGIWKEMANQIGENKYRPSQGSDLFRRSIYTYWKRTIPPPTMLTLDAAERAMCTVKRQMTSTPLQALIVLNDPTYVEAARLHAEALLEEDSDDPAIWIKMAFTSYTGREPSPREQDSLIELFHGLKDEFEDNTQQAEEWLDNGTLSYGEQLNALDLAALTACISTIQNLDESRHY
ncbi:MAG: DUF1553 domain-containing protein [Saprospiraceae bacterium]|nr:DUF1553 domain-containing protein [Saprospiraceae bacterium]